MRLYSVTQDEVYKNWGIKIYAWLRENLFNKATGAVYDNLNGKTCEGNTSLLNVNRLKTIILDKGLSNISFASS